MPLSIVNARELWKMKRMQVCNSKGKYRVEGVSRVWVRDRVLGQGVGLGLGLGCRVRVRVSDRMSG